MNETWMQRAKLVPSFSRGKMMQHLCPGLISCETWIHDPFWRGLIKTINWFSGCWSIRLPTSRSFWATRCCELPPPRNTRCSQRSICQSHPRPWDALRETLVWMHPENSAQNNDVRYLEQKLLKIFTHPLGTWGGVLGLQEMMTSIGLIILTLLPLSN